MTATHGSVAGSMRATIERLREEVSRLTAEVSSARAEVEQWKRNVDNTGAELSEALEEVERMRFYLTPGQRENTRMVMAEYRKRKAAEAEVGRLTREQDAIVEEEVDEQTRSIKAALMDALHDHALDLDLLRLESKP